MNNIVLHLTENQRIIVYLPCSKKELFNWDDVTGFFINYQMSYTLFKDDMAADVIDNLSTKLKKAINNELPLHKSINQDIGYLWSEYLEDKPGYDFVEYRQEEPLGPTWIGVRYKLWSAPREYDTWLYNRENKIILEVTPAYKWHFAEPEEGEEFITYDEFTKQYKPCLIVEIPKEVAREWIRQSEELLVLMRRSSARYKPFPEAES